MKGAALLFCLCLASCAGAEGARSQALDTADALERFARSVESFGGSGTLTVRLVGALKGTARFMRDGRPPTDLKSFCADGALLLDFTQALAEASVQTPVELGWALENLGNVCHP